MVAKDELCSLLSVPGIPRPRTANNWRRIQSAGWFDSSAVSMVRDRASAAGIRVLRRNTNGMSVAQGRYNEIHSTKMSSRRSDAFRMVRVPAMDSVGEGGGASWLWGGLLRFFFFAFQNAITESSHAIYARGVVLRHCLWRNCRGPTPGCASYAVRGSPG